MAYCTKTDIENYLQIGIDDSLDSQITAWIASATAWINRYTDRQFEAAAAIRKYDGNGKDSLVVDDFLSLSAIWFVSNDATSDNNSRQQTVSSFLKYQNSDPNKTPYNKLVISPYASSTIEFPIGYQNVWVHGVFGYTAEVPADISLVCTKLVASVVKVGKDDGMAQFAEADLSISYISFDKLVNMDVGVKEVLDWYKKKMRLTGFRTIRV